MYNSARLFRLVLSRLPIVMVGALAACSDHSDIRHWMDQQQAGRAPVPKLQQTPPQEIIEYKPVEKIDPFFDKRVLSSEKLDQKINERATKLALDLARTTRLNPLERASLSEMKMVGYMNAGKQPVGVVSVENRLYSVRKGDSLGNNFGVIQAITENEIILRETTTNEQGKITQRNSVLSLNDDQGGKTR